MKMNLRSLLCLALSFAILFTSCQKNDPSFTENAGEAIEIKAHAEDQNRVATDLDNLTNEVNAALESVPTFSGRLQNTTSFCGITPTFDTSGSTWKITLAYNGNNCSNQYFRTGTIVLTTAARSKWKNAGATVSVSLQNLKVKRLVDNKSITLNGTQTITNVSGGLLVHLSGTQSITHTITSSNMSVTFDDHTQRTWQIARKRVFTYNNGGVMTVYGIGTNGGVTNAAEWGVNRFGHPFTTAITKPLVVRQDCHFRLTEGEIKHQGFATATLTFGLNANGTATSCPAAGTSYYYRLNWAGPGGNSFSVVLPY